MRVKQWVLNGVLTMACVLPHTGLFAGVTKAQRANISKDECVKCTILLQYIQQAVDLQYQEALKLDAVLQNSQEVFAGDNLRDKKQLVETAQRLEAYLKENQEVDEQTLAMFDELERVIASAGIQLDNANRGVVGDFVQSKKVADESFYRLRQIQQELATALNQFLDFMGRDGNVYHVIQDTVIFDDLPNRHGGNNTVLNEDSSNAFLYKTYATLISDLIKTYDLEWQNLMGLYEQKKSVLNDLMSH